MGGGARPDLHGSWSLRLLRKAAVDAHVGEYGRWCPGYDRLPHAARDLCADHVVAVALGGDVRGPFQVLCRACNSRKGKSGHTKIITPSVRSRDW